MCACVSLLLSAALQGVCPTIRYHQYIIASTICIAHHRALSVFFGRSMPTLAELFSGGPISNVGVAVYRFVSASLLQCCTAQHQQQQLQEARTHAFVGSSAAAVLIYVANTSSAVAYRWHGAVPVVSLA